MNSPTIPVQNNINLQNQNFMLNPDSVSFKPGAQAPKPILANNEQEMLDELKKAQMMEERKDKRSNSEESLSPKTVSLMDQMSHLIKVNR